MLTNDFNEKLAEKDYKINSIKSHFIQASNNLNDKLNSFTEMLIQVLLEDSLKPVEVNLNSILDNPCNVSVSYWTDEVMGRDFFRNFSYLFHPETKINIQNDLSKKDLFPPEAVPFPL